MNQNDQVNRTPLTDEFSKEEIKRLTRLIKKAKRRTKDSRLESIYNKSRYS